MKFEENAKAIPIPILRSSFIYFLLLDENVVYVGQTKTGISRPLSHENNKMFNSIKIIECDKEELDYLEDKYIAKYKPVYNGTIEYALNYSIERVHKKISKRFSLSIPSIKLYEIFKMLKIRPFIDLINGKEYITNADYCTLYNYLKRQESRYVDGRT